MKVEIVLIRTTELEQVVALQQRKIVAEHLIVSIPETATDLLIVRVERGEILGLRLASHNLQRASESGEMRRSCAARPGPPVPQKAVMEVVGRIVGDVAGQSGNH